MDNGVAVGVGHVGVHGQGEDFAGGAFGDGEVAVAVSESGEDRLLMKTHGVVHSGGDAALLQGHAQGFPVSGGYSNGKLRPDVRVPGRGNRGLKARRQGFGVGLGQGAAADQLVFEAGPLGQEYRGLQGVEPGVGAHQGVVVAPESAMGADGAHGIGQGVVVGEQGSAVAIASQGLGREKGGAADKAGSAAGTAVAGSAETLGSVFDNGDAAGFGDGLDGFEVGHLSEQADRYNGLRARGDGPEEGIGVHVEGMVFNIAEHGGGADQGDNLGRADPGEWNGYDFVAGSDAQGAEGDFEAGCTAGDGDAVPGLGVVGQQLLQLVDFRAHDELSVVEHGLHAAFDVGAAGLVLGAQVDELDGVGRLGLGAGCRGGVHGWGLLCRNER
jgi:hypothetical protein